MDKMLHAVTQGNHAPDTVFSGLVQLLLYHGAVLPVVNFSVYKRKGIVLYIGICRKCVCGGIVFLFRWRSALIVAIDF